MTSFCRFAPSTMRKRSTLRAACLALALGLAAHKAARAAPPVAATGALQALDTQISHILKTAGVPGASVVLIEGGRIVLARDFGVADRTSGRLVTPDTVFRAGSISKTFTAMATMSLVEEGRLSLDQPMQELLPEWQHANPWSTREPVRLVHLLEHTAGLDDIRYRHYLLQSAEMPLSAALPAFGPYTSRWAPGSGTAYSNAGPLAAGRAIERVAGTDFARFVTTRLTDPMGMSSARWTRSSDIEARLATSYREDGKIPESFVETPARPSGSLNVSARDLAQLPLLLLGRGTLNGVQLLRPESVARMELPASSASSRRAGAALGWGLGLQANPEGRANFFGHDGSIDGFVARFAYAPTLGGGYVVMANALSDAPMEVATLLRRHLERELPQPMVKSQPLTAAQKLRWAGQYQSVTPRQELLRAVIGLTQWEGAVFDGDVLRYAGKRWLHQGGGVFQSESTVVPGVVFLEGADGNVQAHTRDGARRRVPAAEAVMKIGSMSALALALPGSLLLALVWARAAWRRSLHVNAGGWGLRVLPLLALWGASAIPLGVLAMLASADLEWLGHPTAAGWGIAAMGAVAPLMWLLAWLAVGRAWLRTRSSTGLSVRAWLPAVWHMALSTLLLAWLGAHGWLGLRIWH